VVQRPAHGEVVKFVRGKRFQFITGHSWTLSPVSGRRIACFRTLRPCPSAPRVIAGPSNVGASENLCNTTTGVGCTVPPQGSDFYPFWSLTLHPNALGSRAGCEWNFGNVLPTTFKTFGKDAQYGTPDVARFAGTSTSPVQANPAISGACRFL